MLGPVIIFLVSKSDDGISVLRRQPLIPMIPFDQTRSGTSIGVMLPNTVVLEAKFILYHFVLSHKFLCYIVSRNFMEEF